MSRGGRTVAFVQARMSSARLPGKVLLPLGGRPMLDNVVERLRRARLLDDVWVTTSSSPSDDELAAFCRRAGIDCFRGALDDVVGRILAAASAADADVIVRISGDSPVIDPAVVDGVVERFHGVECDLATNVWPRSFPAGQSVEAVSRPVLAAAAGEMTTEHDREHVTPWFYDHADRYRIENVELDPPANGVRLVVDTEADLDGLTSLMARSRSAWLDVTLQELLLLSAKAATSDVASDHRGTSW